MYKKQTKQHIVDKTSKDLAPKWILSHQIGFNFND